MNTPPPKKNWTISLNSYVYELGSTKALEGHQQGCQLPCQGKQLAQAASHLCSSCTAWAFLFFGLRHTTG